MGGWVYGRMDGWMEYYGTTLNSTSVTLFRHVGKDRQSNRWTEDVRGGGATFHGGGPGDAATAVRRLPHREADVERRTVWLRVWI